VDSLKPVSPLSLNDESQTAFAEALDYYSRQVWRTARKRKNYRYEMAILVNPQEQFPPSDDKALKKFVQAGRELGIDVELITQRDYPRLSEFDALFIRETTSIDHHTYRFARKAASEGLVVIDDPNSILRCTNKVYLADLFRTRKVPAPRSQILHKGSKGLVDKLEQDFGYPMVVKIPDGSFSRGVVKVNDRKELETSLKELFKKSALLLAQEFFYTDYDWRIGILNNKPLYACRYFMVKNHWQIYRHGGKKSDSGGFDTLPTFEVPKAVLRAALAATQPIGNSLYGVDVKEKDGKGYVI
jgi:glutathione synthase/RimK-type ligase-like ATP-grasp enzyme